MKKTMIFILLNNLVNMSGFIDLLAKCIKPTLHERVYDLVTRELNKKWTIKKNNFSSRNKRVLTKKTACY